MDKQQLQDIAEQLPPLQCSGDSTSRSEIEIEVESEFVTSPRVSAYLAYYGIHFGQTLDNIRHGFGRLDLNGYRIATHYWLPVDSEHPPRGTLFVLHGYYDHVGLYHHVIRFALENNLAVVAFDLPGHGLSSGEAAVIDSFDAYGDVFAGVVEKMKGFMPGPWHLLGQSTGAAIGLNYLWRYETEKSDDAAFDKVALLAPLVRSHGWRRDRWLYAMARFLIKKMPRHFVANSHDQDFLDFIATRDPLQANVVPLLWVGAMRNWAAAVKSMPPLAKKLLIVQGDEDTTVDWRYNTALLQQKLPNAELTIISGGRHQLVNESGHYRQQVYAAVQACLDKP